MSCCPATGRKPIPTTAEKEPPHWPPRPLTRLDRPARRPYRNPAPTPAARWDRCDAYTPPDPEPGARPEMAQSGRPAPAHS
jgi:hypothetical protein